MSHISVFENVYFILILSGASLSAGTRYWTWTNQYVSSERWEHIRGNGGSKISI